MISMNPGGYGLRTGTKEGLLQFRPENLESGTQWRVQP